MNSTAFNPNTINFDSFVYERLDELDDLTPDASEPTVTISGKKNRYAAVAEELARRIAAGAFRDCTRLETIRYQGTAAKWHSVIVGGENDPLYAAALRFAQT